jgi:hypothetical protein
MGCSRVTFPWQTFPSSALYSAPMKETDPTKPSGTFDLVAPMPKGCEMSIVGSKILAVDPKGFKRTLSLSIPE